MNITSNSECTGCGICSVVCPTDCIEMIRDNEGFLIPKVDENKCIQCKICLKECHLNHMIEGNEKSPKAYAAYCKEDSIRLSSSSGGIFSVIAEKIIEQNGVVYGAMIDKEIRVRHMRAETKEELLGLRGSKYVQSSISKEIYQSLKQDLKDNRKVLFSGTPCQIGAVHTFLGKDYKNLLTVSFICHGVPSPKVWDKYIEWQEKQFQSKVISANFRDKTYGWVYFSMKLTFENGKEYISTKLHDPFLNIFLKNACLRTSCYNCQYKGEKYLSHCDILLADWWGRTEGILEKDNDDKGLSIVIVNTDKGNGIFLESADAMTFADVDFQTEVNKNIAYHHSCQLGEKRKQVMENIDAMPIDKLYQKYAKTSKIVTGKMLFKKYVFKIIETSGALPLYRTLKKKILK